MLDFLTDALGLYVTFQTAGIQSVTPPGSREWLEAKTETVLFKIDNWVVNLRNRK